MTDDLTRQDEALARYLQHRANRGIGDDLEGLLSGASHGWPEEPEPEPEPPAHEPAVDLFQGTGNVIGTPGYHDPMVAAFRDAGVI